MRILKKVMVRSTWSSLGVVLLLVFGARMALADGISDVLTVSDTLGFSMTMQLLESQEPGKVSIVFPARVLDITNPGGTQLSDILSISSFMVTLSSDGNTSGGPEPPEAALPPIVITMTAVSDQNTPAGISDTLTVTGHPAVSILESIAARSVPFGDGGDSLTISAFTVDLVSLRDQPGADAGSLTDTITINASSDASPIPEPSTLALLGLGLAGAVLTKRR